MFDIIISLLVAFLAFGIQDITDEIEKIGKRLTEQEEMIRRLQRENKAREWGEKFEGASYISVSNKDLNA